MKAIIVLFLVVIPLTYARCICCECENSGSPIGSCAQDMNQDALNPKQVCAIYGACPTGYQLVNAFQVGNDTCDASCGTECKFVKNPTSVETYSQPFQCYAPPDTYATWCDSPYGIVGSTTVTLTVDPFEDTTLVCQMNCCGTISPPFYDEVSCEWDCAGSPEIRCYGSPTGSAYQVIQRS